MLKTAYDYRLPDALKGTVLDNILHDRVHELIGSRSKLPASCMENVLDRAPEIRSFKKALLGRHPAIIAEIKKASPSAGVIRRDFDPVKIARQYQTSGAAALSVITEVNHFHGGLETLARLRWNTGLPLLRKDFIIDRYQILEARHAGADAVLLIAALLGAPALEYLRREAERLGMDALIEVHNDTELHLALDTGATLIGVNNRDLRTFEVSLDVSLKLAPMIPKGITAVAESGIRTAEDMRKLSAAGFRGFLVGEYLMRSASPGEALAELLRH
ncbi:MAG: indole-3-glycerol phosphate synthase TrpC [Acidobacteria bacterium]|nr:indole-3-glycerol phosphate synthase TrpC [Acidobacteriota bacterium]